MTTHDLILNHMHIAEATARAMFRRAPMNSDLEAMTGDGYVGLCQAARDFDASLGWKFTTFAQQRISGAIIDGLRARNHTRTRAKNPGTAPKFFSLERASESRDGRRCIDRTTARPVRDELALRDELEFVRTRMHLPASVRHLVRLMAAGSTMADAAEQSGITKGYASKLLAAWREEMEVAA